jgi:hypothetical protein
MPINSADEASTHAARRAPVMPGPERVMNELSVPTAAVSTPRKKVEVWREDPFVARLSPQYEIKSDRNRVPLTVCPREISQNAAY